MGGTVGPKSQVSRLCEEIDERVDAFLTRPIASAARPAKSSDLAAFGDE